MLAAGKYIMSRNAIHNVGVADTSCFANEVSKMLFRTTVNGGMMYAPIGAHDVYFARFVRKIHKK